MQSQAPETPNTDLDTRKAENKRKRDALAKELAADLGTTLNVGADPKHVKLMVRIMRTYIDDGVVEFERAWQLFKAEYPEIAGRCSEHRALSQDTAVLHRR